MNTILPEESDLVAHFAEMTSRWTSHIANIRFAKSSNGQSNFTNRTGTGCSGPNAHGIYFRRIVLPENYENLFFDRRIDYPPSWKYHSEESYAFIEIRRYIQFDEEENDTSLDCHLYFPLRCPQKTFRTHTAKFPT